ncbi:hypothetical protein [Maritimibacter sp. 55A14]|uniref:hypothetical protein n=1 Tax=Maritimibacter sp. 55A14 TaxID=2174844 RepID=UPI0011B2051A|nr:hypothetical protein [Maritimibacter sp. 55A14]
MDRLVEKARKRRKIALVSRAWRGAAQRVGEPQSREISASWTRKASVNAVANRNVMWLESAAD